MNLFSGPNFTLTHQDGAARRGILHTAHGDVQTPAFVPLATKGVIKSLEVREADELGFELVLGNTFHLMLAPGEELIKEFGGLHTFMKWDRPIITDSGGFQVFSMGHGRVADEVKGRGAVNTKRAGAITAIEEAGVHFRSYLDGSKWFMSPERSMAVQAALGSDIALVFDECTPFHVTKQYTKSSTERTHRWLERCLSWHREYGSPEQLIYGIVQGGVYQDLRALSTQYIAESNCAGIAIGGSLGETKAQMYEVVSWVTNDLPPEKPRHLLGIGDVDDLIRGVELGIDTFDCAMPTRLGRHGMALIPAPQQRWRVNLTAARWRTDQTPILAGCKCSVCQYGYTRGYIHYLFRQREQTGQRLLTIHNLHFISTLMADLRTAIATGTLQTVSKTLRSG